MHVLDISVKGLVIYKKELMSISAKMKTHELSNVTRLGSPERRMERAVSFMSVLISCLYFHPLLLCIVHFSLINI